MEVWKTDQKWRHFWFKTVSFGDKPAGVFLNIILYCRKVAAIFSTSDPSAVVK